MNTTATTTAALAALRAKLAGPDPRDGTSAIDIDRRTSDVQTWPSRRDADAALRKLRQRGLNVDKSIRIQRARYSAWRPYVITRLGDLGETLLMTEGGLWVPGRLIAEQPGDCGAIWMPYDGAELIPATFTHVTTTGIYAVQDEYQRVKSTGQVLSSQRTRHSFARCTCGWRGEGDDRPAAQAAARVHRFEVAA